MSNKARGLVVAVATTAALIGPATAIARAPATGPKKRAIVAAIIRRSQPRPSVSQAVRCLNAWTFQGFAYVANRRGHPCSQPSGWFLDVEPILHNTHGRWGIRLTTQNYVFTAQLRRLRIPLAVYKNLTHQPVLCSPGDHQGCMQVPN